MLRSQARGAGAVIVQGLSVDTLFGSAAAARFVQLLVSSGAANPRTAAPLSPFTDIMLALSTSAGVQQIPCMHSFVLGASARNAAEVMKAAIADGVALPSWMNDRGALKVSEMQAVACAIESAASGPHNAMKVHFIAKMKEEPAEVIVSV